MANKKEMLDQSLLCYLSPKAKELFDVFVASGMDKDLALATLELMGTDTLIWNIELEKSKKL